MSAGRLRRALLFVPGDERRKCEKGATVGADAIIFDLEDGVAASHKTEARSNVVEILQEIDYGGTERLVRLNPVSGPLWVDDLTATIEGLPDGYVLPKVEHAQDVLAVEARLDALEDAYNLTPGTLCLLLFIETALGIVNLREIATSSRRVDALILGAEDLSSDLGAVRTPGGDEIAYARSALVMHAKAFGLDAIDTVFVDLHDLDALKRETDAARRIGYTGKLAIHPRQVEPIQQTFVPTEEEIARAQRLIDAFRAQDAAGVGVFDFDGKMVDMPMLRAAETVLTRARAAGVL